MAIYLITHGDRENGPDPVHTPEGIAQIEALPLPKGINLIVSGTGKRFIQIADIVSRKLDNPEKPLDTKVQVVYCPFCGGPEGFQGKDEVVLTNGRIINYRVDYVGVSNGPLDMWEVVKYFQVHGNVLLCAGGAFMIGLGLKAINQKGHLYELDPATRTGKMIA